MKRLEPELGGADVMVDNPDGQGRHQVAKVVLEMIVQQRDDDVRPCVGHTASQMGRGLSDPPSDIVGRCIRPAQGAGRVRNSDSRDDLGHIGVPSSSWAVGPSVMPRGGDPA